MHRAFLTAERPVAAGPRQGLSRARDLPPLECGG